MNRGFAWGAALGLLAGVGGTLLWRSGDEERASEVPTEAVVELPARTQTAPSLSPATTTVPKKELDRAQGRIAELTRELEAAKSKPPTTPAPSASAAPARAKQEELPAAAREHATRKGVSEEVLALLWHARNTYWGADAKTREEAVAPLRPHGAEVVRGVTVLNQAGGGHVALHGIVAELRLANGADVLIRMIEEDAHASSLIRSLPAYDSPRVRAYLVERIGREIDPARYWYVAEALSDLKEPKGAEAMALRQFLGPTWAGVRGFILSALGRMGGPAAIRLLDEYLALPGADHVGAALAALAKLDRERARSHAQSIKQSDRYGFLEVVDRVEVDRHAADDAAPNGTRKVSAR